MTVQVLVATMHQKDYSLLKKMNIQSDAIVGNQCNVNSIDEFEYNGHSITYLNFAERGVGLNRNNMLMRATGDICLFADDDMIYCDGYVNTIEKAFRECPDADVVIFNLVGRDKGKIRIKKINRVNYFNFLRYGTARIAIKLSTIKKNGIYFNQCFGGGTEHCHGEDNLFLASCLSKKLKIYAVPEYIATLTDERVSSWNNGYDEKYVKDQGVLFRTLSRRWWRLLCLQDALRRHKSYNMRFYNAFMLMLKSANNN